MPGRSGIHSLLNLLLSNYYAGSDSKFISSYNFNASGSKSKSCH